MHRPCFNTCIGDFRNCLSPCCHSRYRYQTQHKCDYMRLTSPHEHARLTHHHRPPLNNFRPASSIISVMLEVIALALATLGSISTFGNIRFLKKRIRK